VFLLFGQLPAAALTLVVPAPDHDCFDLPLTVPLPGDVDWQQAAIAKPDGTHLAGQVVRDGAAASLVLVLDRLPAGTSLTCKVERSEGTTGGGVALTPVEGGVQVTVDGRAFTTYLSQSGGKPICYPLTGPTGQGLTRNYPMKAVPGEKQDHPHHRSLWFTFGDVNGVDFWAETDKSGQIRQTSLETVAGPVVGILRTTNDWVARDGTRVCSDRREFRFYRTDNGRLFDVTVTVLASAGRDVVFGDTKEGMFGIRLAETMRPEAKLGGVLVNAKGERNEAAWGRPAVWLDASGPVEGQVVGLAMLEHPSSFRAPTYWHARTYGLIAANPFAHRDFLRDKTRNGSHTIPAGQSIRFSYRVWLHRGTAEDAGVDRAWQQYAAPPQATVQP
jgi:hypothetical protein